MIVPMLLGPNFARRGCPGGTVASRILGIEINANSGNNNEKYK